jgi:hypothetical protein
MGATFNPSQGFRWGDKPMGAAGREAQAGLSFVNPLASVTDRVLSGESPRFSDFATDAGLLAAGLIPVVGPGLRASGQAAKAGSRAASNAPITGGSEAAQQEALRKKLLNWYGPEAVYAFRQNPTTAYNSNRDLLSRFFSETPERISGGTQLFRAPSEGEVLRRLPREVGAEWVPGTVKSAAGSSDLPRLQSLFKNVFEGSGTMGNQAKAPGMAVIDAMEDLPGIANINTYLSRQNPNWWLSEFGAESVLGPQIRYVVRDFVEDAGQGFPTWYLNAFAK